MCYISVYLDIIQLSSLLTSLCIRVELPPIVDSPVILPPGLRTSRNDGGNVYSGQMAAAEETQMYRQTTPRLRAEQHQVQDLGPPRFVRCNRMYGVRVHIHSVRVHDTGSYRTPWGTCVHTRVIQYELLPYCMHV